MRFAYEIVALAPMYICTTCKVYMYIPLLTKTCLFCFTIALYNGESNVNSYIFYREKFIIMWHLLMIWVLHKYYDDYIKVTPAWMYWIFNVSTFFFYPAIHWLFVVASNYVISLFDDDVNRISAEMFSFINMGIHKYWLLYTLVCFECLEKWLPLVRNS